VLLLLVSKPRKRLSLRVATGRLAAYPLARCSKHPGPCLASAGYEERGRWRRRVAPRVAEFDTHLEKRILLTGGAAFFASTCERLLQSSTDRARLQFLCRRQTQYLPARAHRHAYNYRKAWFRLTGDCIVIYLLSVRSRAPIVKPPRRVPDRGLEERRTPS
jgi:hypothetical protein